MIRSGGAELIGLARRLSSRQADVARHFRLDGCEVSFERSYAAATLAAEFINACCSGGRCHLILHDCSRPSTGKQLSEQGCASSDHRSRDNGN